MWLGSTAQHAVRAVLYIAEHGTDAPVRVDEIAAALDAPRNYLSKTLHQLVRARVLRSVRGPNGGFQLADAPDALSVARIVAPFLPSQQTRCLLGRPTCGGANPCAAHHRWKHVADDVVAFFEETSAAQLLAGNGTPRPPAKSPRPKKKAVAPRSATTAPPKRPAPKRPAPKRPAPKRPASKRLAPKRTTTRHPN